MTRTTHTMPTGDRTSGATSIVGRPDRSGRLDLAAHESARRAPCPEEVARVLATAADLVVQGRRVTDRLLAALTGLEPEVVGRCLHELTRTGLVRPAGAAPHHYVFPPGRWPGDAAQGRPSSS